MIDIILQLMENGGVTPAKLLTDLGLPKSSITEWKKGKSKPGTTAITKIADYFGVTTDYLLGLSQDSTTVNFAMPVNSKVSNVYQNSGYIKGRGTQGTQISAITYMSEEKKGLFDIYDDLTLINKIKVIEYAHTLQESQKKIEVEALI